MPWTLTTPLSQGDVGDDITTALIHDFIDRTRNQDDVMNEKLFIEVQWGNIIDGLWVEGLKQPVHVTIEGDALAALLADKPDVQFIDPSNPGRYWQVDGYECWVEYTYYASKRSIYEWLNDNGYITAGTMT